MTPILPVSFAHTTLRRGGRTILGPLDLTLPAGGRITVLMGPNGAGKTSLLRLMAGLERRHDGAIRWAAPEATVRPARAMMFQAPTVLRRSVLANLVFPLRLAGMSRKLAQTRAIDAAAQAGLSDHLAAPADSLSGGERQKLALARALITSPQMLLLDEPSAALDGAATTAIEARLIRARADGVAIVMATHDRGQARRLADDVIFLHHGRILAYQPRETFFTTPADPSVAAYLNGDILP